MFGSLLLPYVFGTVLEMMTGGAYQRPKLKVNASTGKMTMVVLKAEIMVTDSVWKYNAQIKSNNFIETANTNT